VSLTHRRYNCLLILERTRAHLMASMCCIERSSSFVTC
jgi:hypothetical protein